MLTQNFIEEFSSVIEIPKEMLTDDFNLGKDAPWDSLAFISTIALIDKYFGVIIEGDSLSAINTFGEFKSLLIGRLN